MKDETTPHEQILLSQASTTEWFFYATDSKKCQEGQEKRVMMLRAQWYYPDANIKTSTRTHICYIKDNGWRRLVFFWCSTTHSCTILFFEWMGGFCWLLLIFFLCCQHCDFLWCNGRHASSARGRVIELKGEARKGITFYWQIGVEF